MSRILLTVGARLAGGRVAPPEPPMRDTSEAQPGLRVSLLVARPDADAEGADSVAGCEFLDDRLRLEE